MGILFAGGIVRGVRNLERETRSAREETRESEDTLGKRLARLRFIFQRNYRNPGTLRESAGCNFLPREWRRGKREKHLARTAD